MRKLRLWIGIIAVLACLCWSAAARAQVASIEQWGMFEVTVNGPATGNPFTDVPFSATFTREGRSVEAAGFYDGKGVYKARFMPTQPGEWAYTTKSSVAELNGKSGTFTCVKATGSNHGPVDVKYTYHFAYADGTPYFQIGTTCYAWTHEQDPMEEATLATLKTSPFNKVRMCVFPTRFPSKRQLYPFERAGGGPGGSGGWDYTKFNPEFFQHLEKRVGELRDLGVEADLILFHPYENATGFNGMNAANDERYIRYIAARLSSYRNVWWSLANEYDLLRTKKEADWDAIFHVVVSADPFAHLRSIHFSQHIYNNNQPWVTHASMQNGEAVQDFGRSLLYRDVYNKPIVFDEVNYEGDVPDRWGHLTGEEMTDEFWHGTIDGTYVGHSETYMGDQANWLSRGGQLLGTSHLRLAFLKKIMETAPATGIDPIDKWRNIHIGGKAGEYYLYYFGKETPAEWLFELPKRGVTAGMKFHVDVLDTWNMTITPVEQVFTLLPIEKYEAHAVGMAKVALPGKPYIALRITIVR